MAATVLVADDDADIVRFVEIYLRLEGFEVVTARDAHMIVAVGAALLPRPAVLGQLPPDPVRRSATASG